MVKVKVKVSSYSFSPFWAQGPRLHRKPGLPGPRPAASWEVWELSPACWGSRGLMAFLPFHRGHGLISHLIGVLVTHFLVVQSWSGPQVPRGRRPGSFSPELQQDAGWAKAKLQVAAQADIGAWCVWVGLLRSPGTWAPAQGRWWPHARIARLPGARQASRGSWRAPSVQECGVDSQLCVPK